jgi:hypothetical protein
MMVIYEKVKAEHIAATSLLCKFIVLQTYIIIIIIII